LHRVKRGDSLYSIAWRYGLDYRDLSHWNAIAQPYTIYPRQLLRVSRPDVLPPMPAPKSTHARSRTSRPAPSNTKPVTSAPAVKPAAGKKASPPRAQSKKSRPAAVATTRSQRTVRDWRWPVKGKVIGSFGKAGGKGIDIAGRRGSAIKAAAPGHVVYSGIGLRGYGRLIIVKHNKRYLSAYAHNDRLHVKEGDTVQGGQRIAEMGDSGAKSVRLHFEIRRDGKPVDPTRFLPR
jgi:lipoprotein NlpD